jgi:hypothetical protein
MYDVRCTMYDLREGTQMGLMIKISHDHNHHDHLRSLSFALVLKHRIIFSSDAKSDTAAFYGIITGVRPQAAGTVT